MSASLTSIERLKLVIVSLDTFSDEETFRVFLDTEVESEDDICQITRTLSSHRPLLAKRIAESLHSA